jgi:hypothetical protein
MPVPFAVQIKAVTEQVRVQLCRSRWWLYDIGQSFRLVRQEQNVTTERLPELLRPLFWDYDFESLGWPTSRDLVVARILQNGGDDAVRWLRQVMEDAPLGAWIRKHQGGGMDPRRLRFWQLMLDLPEDEVNGWIEALSALPGSGQWP